VVALERWPHDGIPRNPGAWLTQTAKNRQIDLARRAAIFRRRRDELGSELERAEELSAPSPDEAPVVDDDVLRLIFTTCHPLLSRESQVALTLRLVGGLTTGEIARALLTSEQTVGQRISRAKRTLADAGSPFELPGPDELDERTNSVLGVIYLIFNEGYSATSGSDWMRVDLCEDALRLSRLLQGLMPEAPEVHGLAALTEIQASRTRARTDSSGRAIPLLEQNRALWDRILIGRGLAALDRALTLPAPKGTYTLQAQIAACHARAARPEDTDWQEIAQLYAYLHELTGSPVVAVNRAVAVSYAESPEAGLVIIESVRNEGTLADYPHLHAVRGDLLARAGRDDEAANDFARAAELTGNDREREVYAERVARLSSD
jgi:RNA polymerase sigma factor (sigma-70 family)